MLFLFLFLPLRHRAAVIKIISFTWTFFLSCHPAINQAAYKVALPAASSTDCLSNDVKYCPVATCRIPAMFKNTQLV